MSPPVIVIATLDSAVSGKKTPRAPMGSVAMVVRALGGVEGARETRGRLMG